MAVDGTYNTEMTTPMGKQTGTVTIKSAGNTVSGTFKSSRGNADFTGTLDGANATWQQTVPSPMGGTLTLTFKVTADGEKLSGNVQLGQFGNAPITGTKA